MLFIVTDKFPVGRAQRDHINIRIFAFDMRLKHAVILAALSEPCKNTPDDLARCGSMAIEQASADKCSRRAFRSGAPPSDSCIRRYGQACR